MSRRERLSDKYRRENAVDPAENQTAIYDSYGESDGTYVVGELVDVRLPTGDWVLGAIVMIDRFLSSSGSELYVKIVVVKGNKMWGVEVRSPRDIRLKHRMRPLKAWLKY